VLNTEVSQAVRQFEQRRWSGMHGWLPPIGTESGTNSRQDNG